jgi:hypothetical protein
MSNNQTQKVEGYPKYLEGDEFAQQYYSPRPDFVMVYKDKIKDEALLSFFNNANENDEVEHPKDSGVIWVNRKSKQYLIFTTKTERDKYNAKQAEKSKSGGKKSWVPPTQYLYHSHVVGTIEDIAKKVVSSPPNTWFNQKLNGADVWREYNHKTGEFENYTCIAQRKKIQQDD